MSVDGGHILHVLVVGFHHKRGCQIDFSFPPIGETADYLPPEWVNLPSLALPDGAHNTQDDFVYFLLPSRDEPGRSIFGISCYRQIAAKELVSKSEDVTRSTVQKSVCVLCRVPLFGVLKAKLQLITHAYFNQKDFTKVEVLSQMYRNLCEMFEGDLLDGQAACIDISVRDLVKRFKHRAVLLFKLMLLEKKVVFNIFPVGTLGDIMIALASLFPRLLDEGLFYAALPTEQPVEAAAECTENSFEERNKKQTRQEAGDEVVIPPTASTTSVEDRSPAKIDSLEDEVQIASDASLPNDPLSENKDSHGFPLSIFTNNNLFHPYLSICYMDMIRSTSVRAFSIGCTNQLFVQRRNSLDAIVSLDDQGNGVVEVISPELRRQLSLTTADLRFGDYLIKNVEQNDLIEAAWEGSDEWLRLQFRSYLLSMAASARSELQTSIADHGTAFVMAWKETVNYRIWMAGNHVDLTSATPGHTFSGQAGVRDVALMVEHAVAGSEGAKRALSAISSTGRNLGETGSRVRQSFSSWFRGAATAVGQAAGSLQAGASSAQVPPTNALAAQDAAVVLAEEAVESVENQRDGDKDVQPVR